MNPKIALILSYAVVITVVVIIFYKVEKNTTRGAVIDSNELPRITKMVENLNSGGCGFFALKLYERLDTSKYDIISIDTLSHVCLLDKKTGFYIDSRGYHPKLSMSLRWGNVFEKITADSLRQLLCHTNQWNHEFDWKDTAVINFFIEKL